ncbi:MAG TPA: PadR family transcriptional regulator [Thermoleophilaceae bacterium]|jgi:DNA-binding PadR family transcriptional regulator
MTHAHSFEHPALRHFMAMTGGRRRHGRHRGGPGFGGWGGPGFGGGPPFGRRRRPRGDVRAAMLLVLDEEPMSGYGLMQEIENRSEGVWRPSPGSVYPALAQLEDEGLVRAEEDQGRKRYVLTDAGKAHVEERREEMGEPWAGLGDEVGEGRLGLRDQFVQLATAAYQVGTTGDDKQVEEARKVLDDARRALYRILAGDEPAA